MFMLSTSRSEEIPMKTLGIRRVAVLVSVTVLLLGCTTLKVTGRSACKCNQAATIAEAWCEIAGRDSEITVP